MRAGRARLEERLRLYCLVERRIKGDGNCQFRSLSDQLFRCGAGRGEPAARHRAQPCTWC